MTNSEAKETKDLSTPRPWREFGAYNNDKSKTLYHIECDVNGRIGEHVASTTGHNREVNASLIVRCVNNHEALLEACRRAYLLLDAENNHGMGKRTDALSYEVYKDLEQAIANATK